MTLRPEYALGHSPYNDFLFAAIGEEPVGGPLTVLTALTRLGYDPWQEAARLSDMPRASAADHLAATIAKLPEGDWKATDAPAIAARLVDCLPPHGSPAVPAVAAPPPVAGGKMRMRFATLLAWAVLGAALLYLASNFLTSNNLELGGGLAVTTQG